VYGVINPLTPLVHYREKVLKISFGAKTFSVRGAKEPRRRLRFIFVVAGNSLKPSRPRPQYLISLSSLHFNLL